MVQSPMERPYSFYQCTLLHARCFCVDTLIRPVDLHIEVDNRHGANGPKNKICADPHLLARAECTLFYDNNVANPPSAFPPRSGPPCILTVNVKNKKISNQLKSMYDYINAY